MKITTDHSKKACVLLDCGISNDARVIRLVRELSKHFLVHLFYIDPTEKDNSLFDQNVVLCPLDHPYTWKTKFVRHTFFYNEFNHFVQDVKRTGHAFKLVWANDLPTLNPAMQIARANDAHLVYDAHEIYTETINQFFDIERTSFPKSLIFRALIRFMRSVGRAREKGMVQNADTFITVNESIAKLFEDWYKVDKVKVMMNCPDLQFAQNINPVNFREQFDWSRDDIIFIYQGLLNKGRGLPLLCEAMNLLESNHKLVIVGFGPFQKKLEAQCIRLGLQERVKFIGRVPYDQLANHTAGADVGINLLEPTNLSKQLASPNKLFEYIHVGIPVVCSDMGENKLVLKQYSIGSLTANKPEDIAQNMKDVSQRNTGEFQKHLQEAALKFSWEKQSAVIHDLIQQIQ